MVVASLCLFKKYCLIPHIFKKLTAYSKQNLKNRPAFHSCPSNWLTKANNQSTNNQLTNIPISYA